jgi:hypothetical protein
MKKLALFLGYGLLPLWGAVVIVFVGGLRSRSSEYWAAAPWLIVVSVPMCVATLSVCAITVAVRAGASGDEGRKFRIAARAFWSLNLVIGAIVGALWLRHESLENERKMEEGLALDFVRNHSAVIHRAGSNPAVTPASSTTRSSDAMPFRYEFSVDTRNRSERTHGARYIFAIVSVSRSSGKREFTLDCLTTLSLGRRDPFKDPCKQ